MTISETAITAIKGNNRIMGRLMAQFDRGQKSIENWIISRDVRLITPMAIQIIKEETGLLDSDIIDQGSLVEVQS